MSEWLFANKVPGNYFIYVSAGVKKKLMDLWSAGNSRLSFSIGPNQTVLLHPNHIDGMQTVVINGPNYGAVKKSMSSKRLHWTLVNAGLISASEAVQEVYGHRFSIRWDDNLYAFVISFEDKENKNKS
jgi:hypothetical protein